MTTPLDKVVSSVGPEQVAPIPIGPAAAAILAAAIGTCALGVLIILATASTAVKNFLTFSTSVGPLSGKTTVAIVIWLISWAVLHRMWRGRSVRFPLIYAFSLILILLGLIGSFPPVFEAFEH